MEAFLIRIKNRGVFLLFVLLCTLTHLPFLNYPPQGMHVWRQCNTLAMSRNFMKEDMNILRPRIDRRNERDGVTGSHFPLYEWGLAVVWKITGESETVARLYSLILFSFAMTAWYLLLCALGSGKAQAFLSSGILLSVPQLYYDSINAMPDLISLLFAISALLYVIRYLQSGKGVYLLLLVLSASIAGAVKFQYLLIPFSGMAYMGKIRKRNLRLMSALLIPIAVTFCWFSYAIRLTEASNLREFGLWLTQVSAEKWFKTIQVNLLSDLPEKLTGWPLLISVLYFIFRKSKSVMSGKFVYQLILWAGGFLVFYTIAIDRMGNHGYYFIALIPLFVLIHHKLAAMHRYGIRILAWVCILNTAFAMLRIIPGRWSRPGIAIAEEFADPNKRDALRKLIPAGKKVVTGPDVSGCIFFYFTDTEGYSFENTAELFVEKPGGPYIVDMIKQGAVTLVVETDEHTEVQLKPLQGKKLLGQVGQFQVWDIRNAFVSFTEGQ